MEPFVELGAQQLLLGPSPETLASAALPKSPNAVPCPNHLAFE